MMFLYVIAGRVTVDEAEIASAEDQHRATGIEIETVARTKRKNVNVSARDCQTLRKNT